MSVSLCGPVDIRVYLPVYELVSESHVQTLPKYASVGHERGLRGPLSPANAAEPIGLSRSAFTNNESDGYSVLSGCYFWVFVVWFSCVSLQSC